MKKALSLLIAAMVLPVAVSAEEPTTRPTLRKEPPTLRPIGPRVARDGTVQLGGQNRQGASDERPITDEEKQQALEFMKENFPVRTAMLNALPREGMGQRFREQRAIPAIVQRWRKLKELERQNPQAYAAMMKQAKLQDEAFGLFQDMKGGDPEAGIKLRSKVGEMVQAQLDDRQERIDRLTRMLEEQKQQLARDVESKDRLVDEAVKRLENEADGFHKFRVPFDRPQRDKTKDDKGKEDKKVGVIHQLDERLMEVLSFVF